VMSQRLVRLLCNDCKEQAEPNAAERELLRLDAAVHDASVYHAKGCERCKYTGYRGRTGIYEIIEIDDAMRQMIYENANEQDILKVARVNYPGIESDGRRRILAGETSIEEVMRVTSIA
jgi:general secretion pathway protein E